LLRFARNYVSLAHPVLFLSEFLHHFH
jgi:hypothetical protein